METHNPLASHSIATPLDDGSELSQGTESCAPRDRIPNIQDYGIIGDCRTAALVSCDGSIDWLCWPRFDKPSIFAALLDLEKGGNWRIAPKGPHARSRKYVYESNVLQTTFQSDSGSVVVTDLMPVGSESYKSPLLLPDHEILRRVECVAGEVEMEVLFAPRACYGLRVGKLQQVRKLGLRMEVGRGVYWLRSSLPLTLDGGDAFARISMRFGDTVRFSLTYAEESPAVLPPLDDAVVMKRIEHSVQWWRRWAGHAKYDGSFRDEVVRSALTLKLLSYAPSGAIIAAPTTSLPERIGGSWNWDYRYCWLRDASLTIRALLGLGYREEADDFLDWMLQATRLTQPELRILYDVYGNLAPKERTLDWLSGYRGSRPVRLGNGARYQVQLDVYGEVIDAATQYAFRRRRLDRDMQKVLIGFGNYVADHWSLPDEGIWEPRSGRRHHTHSRLLCWVAMDRLISLYRTDFLKGAPVENYARTRDLIQREIQERGWNPQLQSYVNVLDGDELDSSLLLLSWYGFEKADSPRMKSTYRAILEHLGTTNGLLYRYHSDPLEGTFAICSFWEAEYLGLGGGSLAQAHALFRRLMAYRNDLGLYAEEIEPRTGDALGNFPQAFTHIGLISAALSIRERETGEQQLSHRPEQAGEEPTVAEEVTA